MKYVRGCTKSDKLRNEAIRSDVNIFSLDDKIEENKTKWRDHVDIMVENRLPEKIINYWMIRKRDLGRTCTR